MNLTYKVMLTILLLFVGCAFFAGIMEGGGGMYSTKLNGAITNADVIVTVDSNTGFLTTDLILIDGETIFYTGLGGTTQFTGCTRGYNNTLPVAHFNDAKVYGRDSGVINTILGFNIMETWAGGGLYTAPMILGDIIKISLPRLVMWDFGVFNSGLMSYFKIPLYCISGAFVFVLIFAIGSAILYAVSNLLSIFGH